MKSKVPLEILELLKPNQNKRLVSVEAVSTNAILTLKPKSKKFSDFSFEVLGMGITSSATVNYYHVRIIPASRGNTEAYEGNVMKNSLEKKLNEWLIILEEYDNIESIFDDPILKKYQQDFEEKLKSNDKDADYAPFDLEKQMALIDYLDVIIEKSNSDKDDENRQEVEVIIQESEALKKEATKLSKNESIRRLAKILGRVQKVSIKLIKEVLIKTAAEITTKLILGNG